MSNTCRGICEVVVFPVARIQSLGSPGLKHTWVDESQLFLARFWKAKRKHFTFCSTFFFFLSLPTFKHDSNFLLRFHWTISLQWFLGHQIVKCEARRRQTPVEWLTLGLRSTAEVQPPPETRISLALCVSHPYSIDFSHLFWFSLKFHLKHSVRIFTTSRSIPRLPSTPLRLGS